MYFLRLLSMLIHIITYPLSNTSNNQLQVCCININPCQTPCSSISCLGQFVVDPLLNTGGEDSSSRTIKTDINLMEVEELSLISCELGYDG